MLRKGPFDRNLHGVPPPLLPFHTLGLDPQHPITRDIAEVPALVILWSALHVVAGGIFF